MGINRWEDPKEIKGQIRFLRNEPIWAVYKRYYEENVDGYFEANCKKSKEMYEEALESIPGGLQHRQVFAVPFSLTFAKREDHYLIDIDGNKYIDFYQGDGGTVLGYKNKTVKNKANRAMERSGAVTGFTYKKEVELAQAVKKHMPSIEMIRMMASPTEAAMAAVKVARVFTNKKRIVKIGGAYNGWYDELLLGNKIPGSGLMLDTFGINRAALKYTKEVRPNDLMALEKRLRKNKILGGTAAVIMEPIGPCSGTRPVAFDYCKKAKELCEKYGALLIFDETTTAFRLGMGGAQEYLGVDPNMTILGTSVTGGLPGGAIGGKRDCMELLGHTVPTGKHRAYVGGTTAANPAAVAAGVEAIKEILKTKACEKAGEAGDKLTDGLRNLIARYSLPYVVYNQGSIVHLELTGAMSYDVTSSAPFGSMYKLIKKKKEIERRKEALEKINSALMAHGLLVGAGNKIYTNIDTTDQVIEESLDAFEKVFTRVRPEVVHKEGHLGRKDK